MPFEAKPCFIESNSKRSLHAALKLMHYKLISSSLSPEVIIKKKKSNAMHSTRNVNCTRNPFFKM